MIYALADLHLDYTNEKSMEVFGQNWENYQERIFNNWNDVVGPADTVLIPGDISWAMDLTHAYVDLKKIDELNGQKILMKGNHDYWWTSLNKINNLGLSSMHYLQNNSFTIEGYDICGTRGWMPRDHKDFTDHDEKVFTRELMRLENSIKASGDNKKIVMLHYPPINQDKSLNEFYDICKNHKVEHLIYGHLHGVGHSIIKEGNIGDIDIKCVAGDYIDFTPVRIV
ncbi:MULTISPECIES: metallophosphoesterase [Anaerococcus]|uniref:Metallophosphoesterase n=1 Tax=Anaerococcus cruorum TaxID=3115617 RepID=A0ABW9MWZ4_9FIRM